MNAKTFLLAGIAGGIIDFLLGWIFYGMLFKEIYPESENTNLVFIFLGCMTTGFFISYIFNQWASISKPITGLKGGAVIGFFTGLSMNLYMYSNRAVNYQNMVIDVVITIVILAVMGAVIAMVNGKVK